MSQFYISNDDENDALRCDESRDAQRVITITALTIYGRIKAFTGIVQAIEHDAQCEPGKRWRVTMHDSNPATLKFKTGH